MRSLLKYQKTIDKLPLVTRILLLVSMCSVIFIIWYYGFWSPLQISRNEVSNRRVTLEKTVAELKSQIGIAENTLAAKNKAKVAQEVSSGGAQASQLISAQKMSGVLQELLTTRSNMQLLQLQNLPPKAIASTKPDSTSTAFEHSVIIKFKGDYFSTMSYLQAIEKLNWKIFWDKFEYKVIEYPIAEITLQIHTLSEQGDWINV